MSQTTVLGLGRVGGRHERGVRETERRIYSKALRGCTMLHPWLMTVFARRVFSSSAAFPWRGKFDWAAFPETRYPNKWGGPGAWGRLSLKPRKTGSWSPALSSSTPTAKKRQSSGVKPSPLLLTCKHDMRRRRHPDRHPDGREDSRFVRFQTWLRSSSSSARSRSTAAPPHPRPGQARCRGCLQAPWPCRGEGPEGQSSEVLRGQKRWQVCRVIRRARQQGSTVVIGGYEKKQR